MIFVVVVVVVVVVSVVTAIEILQIRGRIHSLPIVRNWSNLSGMTAANTFHNYDETKQAAHVSKTLGYSYIVRGNYTVVEPFQFVSSVITITTRNVRNYSNILERRTTTGGSLDTRWFPGENNLHTIHVRIWA